MPACVSSDNVLTLSFSQYPQLMQTGGSAQVSAAGYSDPVCLQHNIIVICKGPGQYVALASACTHACCQVQVQNSSLVCPCHGAAFDFSGQVTQGPATQPLPSLQTCSDTNGVYVTL